MDGSTLNCLYVLIFHDTRFIVALVWESLVALQTGDVLHLLRALWIRTSLSRGTMLSTLAGASRIAMCQSGVATWAAASLGRAFSSLPEPGGLRSNCVKFL